MRTNRPSPTVSREPTERRDAARPLRVRTAIRSGAATADATTADATTGDYRCHIHPN